MCRPRRLAAVLRAAAEVDAVRLATRRLLRSLDDLTDEQASAPSRLPNWTRAEVITHLARNADGLRGMVEAAAQGEVGVQYPGGSEQRARDIAAGRGERAAALLADVRGAHDRLMTAWQDLPDDAWDRVGRAAVDRTMREFVWARRREVEVHHVDLDVGYESSDWPVDFVSSALDEIFGTFALRATSTRPLLDASYRVVSTDHEKQWRVVLRGDHVTVTNDDEPADGEARGWGCDITAWLYGRDPRGGGVVASGDLGVLRLPQWFPFA